MQKSYRRDGYSYSNSIKLILDNSEENRLFDLLIPNCQKCGHPMSFDEEEKQWYCVTDNLHFSRAKSGSKPSDKVKRDWRRIFVTTLLCAVPFSNPIFLLSVYDRSRSKASNCPDCESNRTEVVDRTLDLKKNELHIVLEYHCRDCGSAWRRSRTGCA